MKKFFSRMFKISIAIVCLAVMGVASLYTYGQYKEYENLKAVEADILSRIEDEKAAQEQLSYEMDYSMTDSYVEKVAREKLGLVKSTDILFVNENQ